MIKKQSCEELLSSGYSITGKISEVDAYCQGKTVIGEECLGGLKTVSILGKCDKSELSDNLEVTRMDLQKLFIQLTND